MRILRVAQKVYPDVTGGGPYHVHAMSRDQAAMGHDVTVVTVADDPERPHTEDREGYTVIRYPPTANALGNDISAGVARYLADASGFDAIHAHSHLYFSTNLAALARRFGDVPLAITNHGLYSQTAPAWVFDRYLRTVGRWTFDRADAVFCYTAADRRRLRSVGVTSAIEVVPNGIDTERFGPAGSGSDRISDDGFAVCFVGRLVEGKRPRDAIDAVGALADAHDAGLYLCGDGPLRDDLERYVADRGLEDAVAFLGQLPYDEMPAVYRSADALVLPSRAEGLPRTVLEAMACGVPVVCSDLDQVAPAVDGAGCTAPVGDVTGFAAALETLASDHERYEAMRATGRDTVEERFRWAETVERTTDALAALAGRDALLRS